MHRRGATLNVWRRRWRALPTVVSEHQAQVWFSHDPVQTTEVRSASPYYE